MTAERVALDHYRSRRRLVDALASAARRLWRLVDPGAIADSWQAQVGDLVVLTTAAQRAAVLDADDYLDRVLAEQGATGRAEGQLVVPALSGVASDGRDLADLLYQPAVTALTAIGRGAAVGRALAGGYAALDMIVRTQVADAGRAADQVALTARPEASGYVRMVVSRTCARCVILAGRRYRWNTGFLRHPRCDCVHVPAWEDRADDIRTDPKAYFASLTEAEQDKAFTAAGARAIRDGASITQVVNARRGAYGLTPAGARLTADEARTLRGGLERGTLRTRDVYGRQLYVTTEGTTVRGLAGVRLGARETGTKRAGGRYRTAQAPRLMPESIYQIAGDDRGEAIRLLRRFGYIT